MVKAAKITCRGDGRINDLVFVYRNYPCIVYSKSYVFKYTLNTQSICSRQGKYYCHQPSTKQDLL